MRVEIGVLGDFAVYVDGVVVPSTEWDRRQAASLVKLLTLAPSRRLHREQVIDALWPDVPVDEAAPRLHKAAYFARKAVGGAGTVVLRDDTVALFPDADVTVDALVFERLATSAVASRDLTAAEAAIDRYRGDLLPRDLYEPWTEAPRERLRILHVDVLRVAERWDRLLAVEPADEQAHVAIMRAHAARGDRRAALRQFERLEHTLAHELGVGPGDEAVALRAELIEAPRHPAPSSLMGRGVETAAIDDVLGRVHGGRGSVVFVVGPPGIGKSALLGWTRQRAESQGWRTGHGVAAAVEGAWPFAPVLEAFADLCRHHPTLLDGLDDAYREEMSRALRGNEVDRQSVSGRQRLFVAAAELVRLAAADHGLLLTLDDLHQADEASLRLVHYLARTVVDESVAIVVGHRPTAMDTLREVRGSLLGRPGGVEVELSPLDPADSEALIERVAPSASGAAVSRVVALSEGVPFTTVELARRLAVDPDWMPTIDPGVIAGLEPSTREALQRAAVVGAVFDTDQFVALSGLPDDEAFTQLDAALASGVLEPAEAGYRFRHSLLREALLADIPPHRQRRIHRDAAVRLTELAASPARIGHHLLQAGDPKSAVPYVLRAAETEATMGAYRDALDLVDTVRTHASGEHRTRLLALRGDLLTAVGDPAATLAYREALDAADVPAHRALRTRLARAATMSGDLDTAVAALDGLELDGGPVDAEILLARGTVAYLTGDHDTAWQITEEARLRVLQGDKGWQVLELIALQGLLAHIRGEFFDRLTFELQRTRDSPEVASALFDAHLCPAEFLLYGATPYDDVIQLCRELRATANRAGALRAVAFATEVIGEAAFLSGNLDLAAQELQEAVDLHHDIAATGGEAASLQRLAEVRLAQGDRAMANRLLRRALPLARWSSISLHLLQRIFGTMIAAAPDPVTARAIVDRAESSLGPNDQCQFCDITLSVPAAIACADAGDLARARYHLAAAETSARVWEGTSWQAAVLEVRAHIARAEGDPEHAGLLLEEAADIFEQAGHRLDADRCRERDHHWTAATTSGGAAPPR